MNSKDILKTRRKLEKIRVYSKEYYSTHKEYYKEYYIKNKKLKGDFNNEK